METGKKIVQPTVQHTLEDEATLIHMVTQCRREAEMARRDRIVQNKRNWAAYWGRQDFSEKQEGQSTEALPKVGEAVEQFAAFVKRALTQFGDWFSVELSKESPLTPEKVRSLMQCYLRKTLINSNQEAKFPTIISNAVKAGLLESLIVVKVHGHKVERPTYTAGPKDKKPKSGSREVWRLRIDLVPNEDYYLDPTGRKLYEVHRVERDMVDVRAMAEQGIYDKEVVNKIAEDFTRMDQDKRLEIDRNQNETTPPSFRKRVVIEEYWGTLLNPDGSVYMRNGLCAIANEKYVIRKPEHNPFWHGRSPFVVAPLVQVPFTVWGKALYDDAVSLNIALNELFNLMLDGGIAEVWGIRQVRTSWLEDPRQVSGGIPQGATLALNENAPIDGKVVERVDNTGAVPQEAMAMFNLTDREFQAASRVNDVRMGFLPPRAVKATEISEASNNSAALLDSLASDLEQEFIEPVLELTWMLMIQNMDDLAADEVADILGRDAAFQLARMSPADRHGMFASGYGFKAYGLSSTLSRTRDFQKLMALMQAIGTNPMLMQTFMSKYSPEKILGYIMKALNINPESLEASDEEKAAVQQRIQEMQQMTQITGGAQRASPTGGQASADSEISQNAAPTGGPA